MLRYPLDVALMLRIFDEVSDWRKRNPESQITLSDLDALSRLIDAKPSFPNFIAQLQMVLAKHTDERWSVAKAKSSFSGRPLFLHFDEVGSLDDPELVAHLKCVEPRDVFYKFWSIVDGILRQPGCFVYVSGKDSSMDLVAHPGASRGKSSGHVERLLLEPLKATHVVQMLSLPLPSGPHRGRALCEVVFGVDVHLLSGPDTSESKLLSELADLLVELTGGLPRALLYSFMWLRRNVGSMNRLQQFLSEPSKVRVSHLLVLTVLADIRIGW